MFSSIEAAASHEASAMEQKARGELERQKLRSEMEIERETAHLLHLRSTTAAIESTGQAVAEARAQAERLHIEGQSEIEGVRFRSQAQEIEFSAEMTSLSEARQAEVEYLRRQTQLEIEKAKNLAQLEVRES